MNNRNSSSLIQILGGGYLLYLSYQFISDMVKGETKDIWIIIATAVFVISGAVFLVFGIRGMIAQSKVDPNVAADEELNEELEEEQEAYGEFVEPALKEGKMKSIEQELEKLKETDK